MNDQDFHELIIDVVELVLETDLEPGELLLVDQLSDEVLSRVAEPLPPGNSLN